MTYPAVKCPVCAVLVHPGQLYVSGLCVALDAGSSVEGGMHLDAATGRAYHRQTGPSLRWHHCRGELDAPCPFDVVAIARGDGVDFYGRTRAVKLRALDVGGRLAGTREQMVPPFARLVAAGCVCAAVDLRTGGAQVRGQRRGASRQ